MRFSNIFYKPETETQMSYSVLPTKKYYLVVVAHLQLERFQVNLLRVRRIRVITGRRTVSILAVVT